MAMNRASAMMDGLHEQQDHGRAPQDSGHTVSLTEINRGTVYSLVISMQLGHP